MPSTGYYHELGYYFGKIYKNKTFKTTKFQYYVKTTS